MTHLWVRAEQRPNEERVGLTPDDRLHCKATTVCHARAISVRHLNRVLKSLSRQSMW